MGAAGQVAHARDELRAVGGISRAVVPHDGIHQQQGFRPGKIVKKALHQSDLPFAAQKAGINAVKPGVHRLPMGSDGLHLIGHIQKSVTRNAAGLAGQHGGGQRRALAAHHRKHRQCHRQRAAAQPGKVMDGRRPRGVISVHLFSPCLYGQISRRPSRARVRVTSSENSRWPPTGTP